MDISVSKLTSDVRKDFYKVHCKGNGLDWCQCVAWWCPSWKEFASRKAEENKTQRDFLFDQGVYDGYLLYESGRPIGSMQVGQRDRLKKLCKQYGLKPSPTVWSGGAGSIRMKNGFLSLQKKRPITLMFSL